MRWPLTSPGKDLLNLCLTRFQEVACILNQPQGLLEVLGCCGTSCMRPTGFGITGKGSDLATYCLHFTIPCYPKFKKKSVFNFESVLKYTFLYSVFKSSKIIDIPI